MDLKGSITALITPFRNGEVDEQGYRELIEWQIAEGSNGIVPVGTTGESPTLSAEEHKRVIEIAVETAGGRVPVVAGTGSNSTAEAVEFTRHAAHAGADAALVVVPYYNKPTQEGLYSHFKAVAAAADIPIIVYNVPSRTVASISVETVDRLARDVATIIGTKDATADLARVSRQRLMTGTEFIQLSGEDATALGFNAHGGVGCISVTANVAPEQCASFYNDAMAGQWAGALYSQDRLVRLHKALFTDASPSPTKFALAHLGLCREDVRLPIVAASEGSRTEVLAAMRDAGVL